MDGLEFYSCFFERIESTVERIDTWILTLVNVSSDESLYMFLFFFGESIPYRSSIGIGLKIGERLLDLFIRRSAIEFELIVYSSRILKSIFCDEKVIEAILEPVKRYLLVVFFLCFLDEFCDLMCDGSYGRAI